MGNIIWHYDQVELLCTPATYRKTGTYVPKPCDRKIATPLEADCRCHEFFQIIEPIDTRIDAPYYNICDIKGHELLHAPRKISFFARTSTPWHDELLLGTVIFTFRSKFYPVWIYRKKYSGQRATSVDFERVVSGGGARQTSGTRENNHSFVDLNQNFLSFIFTKMRRIYAIKSYTFHDPTTNFSRNRILYVSRGESAIFIIRCLRHSKIREEIRITLYTSS